MLCEEIDDEWKCRINCHNMEKNFPTAFKIQLIETGRRESSESNTQRNYAGPHEYHEKRDNSF